MFRRTVPVLVLVIGAGCTSSSPTPTDMHAGMDMSAARTVELTPAVLASLAQVRNATAQYHDVDAAIAAGYTVWSPDPFAANATCPTNPAGSMGYHLVNVPLRGGAANPAAGDAVIEALQPEMLLYEKRPDGKLHLVGVEYIVFTEAWERDHGAGAAPPEVFGQPLLASAHTFVPNGPVIPHYELHVWLWTTNPLGMFAPWNPTVSC